LPPEGFVRTYVKKDRPVILVFGGSQGSQRINDTILTVLPTLLETYDVVHQTGGENITQVKEITGGLLKDHPFKDRYFAEGFIDVSLFYPKVDLVITRAGSSMFEMVLWQLPMIVIPIPESISRDQRSNAYSMASHEMAIVLEENNMGPNLLLATIARIMDSKESYEAMFKNASLFENSRSAATVIGRELVRIGLSHT
jgi:UDP-N-acetylglucosamine--N-acetylmuramyl-(pentapeptide) pyrophosphoryl-undecaprenol N-acetylglucosamine transferase